MLYRPRLTKCSGDFQVLAKLFSLLLSVDAHAAKRDFRPIALQWLEV